MLVREASTSGGITRSRQGGDPGDNRSVPSPPARCVFTPSVTRKICQVPGEELGRCHQGPRCPRVLLGLLSYEFRGLIRKNNGDFLLPVRILIIYPTVAEDLRGLAPIKGLVASPGCQKKFLSKDLVAEETLKEMLKAMKIPWDPRGTGHIHMEGNGTSFLLN